jgi:hypothetical protein
VISTEGSHPSARPTEKLKDFPFWITHPQTMPLFGKGIQILEFGHDAATKCSQSCDPELSDGGRHHKAVHSEKANDWRSSGLIEKNNSVGVLFPAE